MREKKSANTRSAQEPHTSVGCERLLPSLTRLFHARSRPFARRPRVSMDQRSPDNQSRQSERLHDEQQCNNKRATDLDSSQEFSQLWTVLENWCMSMIKLSFFRKRNFKIDIQYVCGMI